MLFPRPLERNRCQIITVRTEHMSPMFLGGPCGRSPWTTVPWLCQTRKEEFSHLASLQPFLSPYLWRLEIWHLYNRQVPQVPGTRREAISTILPFQPKWSHLTRPVFV